jgi:hypothetical protein
MLTAAGPTYLGDILLHPKQEPPLIQKSGVQVTVLPQPLTSQKSPYSNAVVEVHHNDAVARLLDDLGAIIVGI